MVTFIFGIITAHVQFVFHFDLCTNSLYYFVIQGLNNIVFPSVGQYLEGCMFV